MADKRDASIAFGAHIQYVPLTPPCLFSCFRRNNDSTPVVNDSLHQAGIEEV